MNQHKAVSREEWTEARKALLVREKELTRQRDALSAARRDLPWVRVDKAYVFDGLDGQETLADLFEGRSQLVVYHFMFDPDWETGCKACSFMADNFNGIIPHLSQRDVTFVAVSRAPLAKLQAFEKRLGWSFKWVSSAGTDFNFDYQVSFTPEDLARGAVTHNYRDRETTMAELPGVSVFCKDADGAVFHTYSSYERGLDTLITAYHYLDLVPKGRDEAGLDYAMAWIQLRDEYGC